MSRFSASRPTTATLPWQSAPACPAAPVHHRRAVQNPGRGDVAGGAAFYRAHLHAQRAPGAARPGFAHGQRSWGEGDGGHGACWASSMNRLSSVTPRKKPRKQAGSVLRARCGWRSTRLSGTPSAISACEASIRLPSITSATTSSAPASRSRSMSESSTVRTITVRFRAQLLHHLQDADRGMGVGIGNHQRLGAHQPAASSTFLAASPNTTASPAAAARAPARPDRGQTLNGFTLQQPRQRSAAAAITANQHMLAAQYADTRI